MEALAPHTRTVRHAGRRLVAPSAAERRAHAEDAMDRYLAWCEGYADALTRRSEREARRFALTGEPAVQVPLRLVHVKRDYTPQVLDHYQTWLHQLRAQGLYEGSAVLKRQRPDGAWEPLDLSRDAA